MTLVDLETLAPVLATSEHTADVEATREIVADEVAAFLGWQRAASVAPTVVALREMADDVVQAELVRWVGRLPDLDHRARAEIEQAVGRVVDKLLHAPTVRVKQLAEEPGGQSYADALSKLFGLDPAAVEAVTRADVATDEAPPCSVDMTALPARHPRAARWPPPRRSWSPTRSPRAPAAPSSWCRSRRTATPPARRSPRSAAPACSSRRCATRCWPATVDVAVHSLKDLPTADAEGILLAAVPPREDPRDALVARDGLTLGELPDRRPGRHRVAAARGAAARARLGLEVVAGARQRRHPAATGRPTASSTPSCWPAPGWPGWAGSTRSPR